MALGCMLAKISSFEHISALIKFEFYVHGFSGNTQVISVMQYVKLRFAVSTSSMAIHHLFPGH